MIKRLALLLALVLLVPKAPAVAQGDNGVPQLNSGLLNALEMRNIGPALTSGRVSDIAVDPTDSLPIQSAT